MKSTDCLSLLLVITLELAGCVPASSTMIPTQVKTLTSSPTLIPPTSTSTFTPTATVTPTLYPTLAPEQASYNENFQAHTWNSKQIINPFRGRCGRSLTVSR
jgi:hypothetical protein